MSNLVIVESPSKSKTIEKYLGSDYRVVSSKGHIRDLATKGKGGLGVDIENGFKPTYEISKDKKQTVTELKKYAKKADYVYLATDPDREGEAISWHLADVLGLDVTKENRIVFNEITKTAVLNALKNPRSIDMDLVKSQETRRILDRIIGFKLSKLMQYKLKAKSAGRVQSVAVAMICDREKEINDFVPKEYWTIDADLCKDEKKITASLAKIGGKKANISNINEADDIIAKLYRSFLLSKKTETNKKRNSNLPFITSTMQQEASSKLGFSSKKTMTIAQGLYEGVELQSGSQGLITYMRTDSTRLSNEFVAAAMDLIENSYGKEYKGFYRIKNDDNSQDAHEAIRPTSLANSPEVVKPYLTNDQYKLYKLIYARALASLMAPAVNRSVSYEFTNCDYLFTCSGTRQIFDGFLKVYGAYDSSKDVILPDFNEGDVLELMQAVKNQHFTEGPSRYTEAKLIKSLEEEGVGRPSTYASIIDTIIKRGYVEYRKEENGKTKYFFPTEQGILADGKLREYFSEIINVKYTAEMEKELDQIASGDLDSVTSLQHFDEKFEPLYDTAMAKMEKAKPIETGKPCPKCGKPLVFRKGKYGEFIGCSGYPDCDYISNENENAGDKKDLGNCPECGKPLVEKRGHYGPFIACSGYPDCKYIAKKEKEKPEHIGRQCPKCGSELLKRKSRYGTYFISCSAYPKCKYTESIKKADKDNES
ncbi:MAG: type I DNA topoisomerase [Erysipelotrichaceae bacterium]|nr:type I DNA topoisomerase [Erysipelotrichaceae bacterium]